MGFGMRDRKWAGGEGVHNWSLVSVRCMYGAKFFWGTLCKSSPHCLGSNLWTTNIPTQNIFVSLLTVKKLLCKCAHLLKVYLLNFILIQPFVLQNPEYKWSNTVKQNTLIFLTKCRTYIFTEYPTSRNSFLNAIQFKSYFSNMHWLCLTK